MKIIIFSLIFCFTNFALAEVSNILSDQSFESDYIAKISINKDDEEEPIDYIDPNSSLYGGFNDLISYVVPSPYQEGAGSCLYMAHTGVIEFLMNQSSGYKRYDFSERYFMSLKTEKTGQERVKNWRTDNIERLNEYRIMYKNRDYPFTKGYYKKENGRRVATNAEDEKAKYGTRFNWISYRKDLSVKKSVTLPKFKRNIIFADPDRNQWNVTTAPKNITSLIKRALTKNKAPVLVIYNHKGFWHANYIFGYNNRIKHNCPYVNSYEPTMIKKAANYEKKAAEATTESRRNKYLATAKSYRERGAKVTKYFKKELGGCSNKGAFYVRDSIYPNEDQKLYDFATENTEDDAHLNAELILREYEWVESTLNHAIQILPL